MARRLLNTWLSWLDWPLKDDLGRDDSLDEEEAAPPSRCRRYWRLRRQLQYDHD